MLLPPVRTSPIKLLVFILCHQMVFCLNHRFQPLDSEMNPIQETKIQHVLDNTAHDEENDVQRRILWSLFKDEILGNQHQFPNDRPHSNILSNIFKYPKRQSSTKYFSPQSLYRIPLKENRVNFHYEAAKKVKRQSPDNVFIRFGRNTESISKYSSDVTSELLFTLLDFYFPFNLQSMEKFRTSELFDKSNEEKYYFSNPLKVKVLNTFRENKQKSGKTKLRALQTRNGNALVRFGRSVKEYPDKGFNSKHGFSSKMLNKFNCDEIDDLSFKTFPSVQPDYEFLSKNYVLNKFQKNYNTLPFIFLSCIKGLEKLANIGDHKDISRDTRKVICQKSKEKRDLFSDSNHEKLGPFAEKQFHKRNTNSDIAFDINSISMTPLRKSSNAAPRSRRLTKSMVRFGREPNSVMFRKNVTPLFKFNKLVNPAARFDKTESSFIKFGRANNSTLRFGRSPSSMVRFGKSLSSMMRFDRAPIFTIRSGRSPHSMVRFGRAPTSMIRFGRAPSSMIRYGRTPSSMIRFGRAPSSMIRFGRAPRSMIRFGRRPRSMIRFGRRPRSMIKFGRRPRSMIRFGRRPNSMIRFGRTQSFVKGLQKATDSSIENGRLGRAPRSTIRFGRVPNSKLSFEKYFNESIKSSKKSNMKVSVHSKKMSNKFIGYFTTPSTSGNFNEIIKLTDRYRCLSDKTCVDILKVGRNNHHFHNSATDLLQSTSFNKNENLKHKKKNKNTPSAKSNAENFYLMSP